MINTEITIKLYAFAELSLKAKQRAIEEHRKFTLDELSPSDYADMAKDSGKPANALYELDYEYYLMNDEPIIENIEANEYLYFEDGEMAHVVHYCGGHPLAGQTHFSLYGTDYDITACVE